MIQHLKELEADGSRRARVSVANFWRTYKLVRELGAQVRKGEKSAFVFYAKVIKRTEE